MSEKAERTGEQSHYQSYLLRLWRVDIGREGWRASIESAHTGERRGFATLDALFDYVRSRTCVETSERSYGDGERREGGDGRKTT